MNAVLLNLLTFFFGLLLGNWLTIGRDKRREFNDAATPIRNWLLAEIDDPNPYIPWPSEIEFDIFVSCLPAWKRRRFRDAIRRYREKHSTNRRQDSLGGVHYTVRKNSR